MHKAAKMDKNQIKLGKRKFFTYNNYYCMSVHFILDFKLPKECFIFVLFFLVLKNTYSFILLLFKYDPSFVFYILLCCDNKYTFQILFHSQLLRGKGAQFVATLQN